jgi:hypothetical protein
VHLLAQWLSALISTIKYQLGTQDSNASQEHVSQNDSRSPSTVVKINGEECNSGVNAK